MNKNVFIDRKCVYWMKMCLLNGHNPLGINSGSYSFVNFFSTSSFSSFLETQETCGSSLKLLFVSRFSPPLNSENGLGIKSHQQ